MGPELRRHLGADAEPALEARHGLVEQHAKAIDDRVSPGARCGKERGLERAVDDIGNDRVGWQLRKIDVEGSLAGHAEAGGVDEKAAAGERPIPVIPVDHLHGRPEGCAKASARSRVRLASRILDAPPSMSRPWRIARAAPPAPSTITGRRPLFQSGACAFEIGHEAVSVGVARMQPSGGIEPERIGRADRPCRLVGDSAALQGHLLVRQVTLAPT